MTPPSTSTSLSLTLVFEGVLVDAGLKYQMERDKAGKSTATVHASLWQDALNVIGRFKVGFGEAGATR
jgi:hypothetical protein